MSGDDNPLARDVDRATRKADAALAQAGELDAGLQVVTGRVDEVEQMLAELAQDVAQVVAENQPVRSWILAEDPAQARSLLVDLAEWLERVYLRYPDTRLPSCWMWHPAVVEELLTLRHLHADAYRGRSWVKVGDWHDRWLPGVRERLSSEIGTCRLQLHQPGQRKSQSPAVTPMVQHLDAVVDTWMSTGLSPQPTSSQLDDARTADQAFNHLSS